MDVEKKFIGIIAFSAISLILIELIKRVSKQESFLTALLEGPNIDRDRRKVSYWMAASVIVVGTYTICKSIYALIILFFRN